MATPARSTPCPNCGHWLRRKPWQPSADVIRAHAPHCNPEAWCGCGTRFAGTRLQIAAAAAIHWTICTADWRLYLERPI